MGPYGGLSLRGGQQAALPLIGTWNLESITPHSFIPGLKPSFSANPSHRSLPFLLQD